MTVTVNGEPRDLAVGATIEALVEVIGCGRRGVAVAVNSQVVPRSAWGGTSLVRGDHIEVLRAVQGGC